jgi:hypothetical protein
MTEINSLTKRVGQLEYQLKVYKESRVQRDTKITKQLNEIEKNIKLMLNCYGQLINNFNELKSHQTILTIMHKSELGKLNLDAETWLNPLKRHNLKKEVKKLEQKQGE